MQGRLVSWEVNCYNQYSILTFKIPEVVDFTLYKDRELDIDLKVHRLRRSLNANAYFWQLTDKIAKAMTLPKMQVYRQMLYDYGVFETINGEPVFITTKDYVDMTTVEEHWWKISECDGQAKWVWLKGSSKYDTKEMSHLIDGTVNLAQELGIETLTPDELLRMKGAWA